MMVSMMLNDTVDGRNPAPAGMYKTQQIMGMNYQPQLVQDPSGSGCC